MPVFWCEIFILQSSAATCFKSDFRNAHNKAIHRYRRSDKPRAFQMIAAVVIIAIGVFAFQFTLVDGFVTVLQLLLLSMLGLVVLWAMVLLLAMSQKREHHSAFCQPVHFSTILTVWHFFPITVFPKWLQFFCNILPSHTSIMPCAKSLSRVPVFLTYGAMLVYWSFGHIALCRCNKKFFKWE